MFDLILKTTIVKNIHTLYMSPSLSDIPEFPLTDFLLFFELSESFSLPIFLFLSDLRR